MIAAISTRMSTCRSWLVILVCLLCLHHHNHIFVHAGPSPTSEPTGEPSSVPSSSPSSLPSGQPSSLPSGQPSSLPSGFPSSVPTISALPTTTFPSYEPTGEPSSMPSISFTPSIAVSHATVQGSVEVDRNSDELCESTNVKIKMKFNQPLRFFQSIYIDMPGFTNGPCTSAINGNDAEFDGFMSSSAIRMLWHEGKYQNMYRDSLLRIFVDETNGLMVDEEVVFTIDRHHGLKFSCLSETFFNVTLREMYTTNYYESMGSLVFASFQPEYCLIYDSSLTFFPPKEQIHISLNLTMKLAMNFQLGDNITLYLPGFTNSGSYSSSHSTENYWGHDVIGNTTLASVRSGGEIAPHRDIPWSSFWEEGEYPGYKESRVQFWIDGEASYSAKVLPFVKAGTSFSIYIDRLSHLSTYCGRPQNYDGFTLRVSSQNTSLTTPITVVTSSAAIGNGCPLGRNISNQLSVCSSNGECNYCTGQCECYEGYGSFTDRQSVDTDNFPRDCSGMKCPFGISIASLPNTANTNDSQGLGVHRYAECSNAGNCNRENGLCKCFQGFEGAACQRAVCPGEPQCSGRGMCYEMKELAKISDALPLTHNDTSYIQDYDGPTWDAQSMRACVCDSSWEVGFGNNQVQVPEFFGPACQFRRCPSGDDPTTSSVDETDCYNKTMVGGQKRGKYGNKCHLDCSGRGRCDYSTGTCSCLPGVQGANCGQLIGDVDTRLLGAHY